MGATSGAHTAAEVVMTNPSSRTRVHRPAEFELAGIVTEAALAAVLSRIGLSSRQDERRQVLVLQRGLEVDSDPRGRSIPSLVEDARQGFVG